jgi:hypothetical protein
MIRAWLVHRRETAGARYLAAMRTGTEDDARRARTRLANADLLLDVWTLGGRR